MRQTYITCEQLCYQFNGLEWSQVEELDCTQEEADTRMLLHAKHATNNGYQGIIIPDTDVFVLMLSYVNETNNLFMRTGCRNNLRIIDIEAVKESLLEDIPENVTDEQVLAALPGLHDFTGCDTVSAFSGKGKVKALKIMLTDAKFVEFFESIGGDWTMSDEIYSCAEEFLCHLYCFNDEVDVNILRYEIYCSKCGKCEPEQLPPCRSSLCKHVDRANFRAKLWKSAMISNEDVPCPGSHGWKLTSHMNEEERLEIDWMDCQPEPNEVC